MSVERTSRSTGINFNSIAIGEIVHKDRRGSGCARAPRSRQSMPVKPMRQSPPDVDAELVGADSLAPIARPKAVNQLGLSCPSRESRARFVTQNGDKLVARLQAYG